MPSPQAIKNCLVYSDIAIKMQLIFMDLSSTVWWSTVSEVFIFFYSFWVFCSDAKRTAVFWLFTPHLIRGAIGLLFIKKMPTISDMLKSI